METGFRNGSATVFQRFFHRLAVAGTAAEPLTGAAPVVRRIAPSSVRGFACLLLAAGSLCSRRGLKILAVLH
jgi:hypothetical protein